MSAEHSESQEGARALRRNPPLETLDNPAIVVHFYSDRLHDALAQPNSPCIQQPTPRLSVALFERYVYERMLSAGGASERENGVENDGLRPLGAALGKTYFQFILHRLYEDQYRSVIIELRELFIQSPRPVTQWSLALQQPIGVVFKLSGGTGIGSAFIAPEAMSRGVFRYP